MELFRFFILLIILTVVSAGELSAQDNEQLPLLDSITNYEFVIPNGAKVVSHPKSSMLKYEIDYKDSWITILSKKHPENKKYSWEETNKYIKERGLGHIDSTKRVAVDVDGWHIYHSAMSKNNTPYITCATTIKGKKNVTYIIEHAYKRENLKSAKIMSNSHFIKAPKQKKYSSRNFTSKDIIITIIVVGSAFLSLTIKEKATTVLRNCLCVITTLILIIYYLFCANVPWLTYVFVIPINLLVWSYCLKKKTNELLSILSNVFNNI